MSRLCMSDITTLLTFLLFNIFSTFHSLTFSTSTSFTSSTFYPLTCSLYYTSWLIFTTGWIVITVGNCNLIALVETTSSMIYILMYQPTNFFVNLSLNIKSFVLNITLSPTFHTSVSFLSLSACHFISSYALFNAASISSCTFFIFSMNSVAFSIFSFLLISIPILNSLL